MMNGVPLGKTLSKFSDDNFPTDGSTTQVTEGLLKVIDTSCQVLGHTPEVAKFAQKCYFALNGHIGLNSLFMSITPDDLCSFCVQLYVDSTKFVIF